MTFAHDARRSSASSGCVTGALQPAWTFVPHPVGPRAARVSHLIADGTAVYATGAIGDSPAAWRLDVQGRHQWTFDSRVDIHRAHWATLALGSMLLNDDGLYLIDPDTGKNQFNRGLDAWGQSLSDGSRFYMVNSWHVGGPPLFVGAFDREGNGIWKQFLRGRVMGDVMDDVGGIALDGDTLYFAADYKFEPNSFVAALDPASGEARWSKNTVPIGAPSASDGRVFLVETDGRGRPRNLVARARADGAVAWSCVVEGSPTTPPVVAEGKILLDTDTGLRGWNATDGKMVWQQPHGLPKRGALPAWSTNVVAAVGSNTVVWVEDRHLRVLGLADGAERWSDEVQGVRGMHSPVLVGTRLYVVASGTVVALDP